MRFTIYNLLVEVIMRTWVRMIMRVGVVVVAAAGIAQAGMTEVVIFHTTDLHGQYAPVIDYDGVTNVGGLYQLAAALEECRREHTHSIVVDNGDTYQGSLMSWLTRGHVVMETLNLLGHEVWNIGNHDFDWGVDILGLNMRLFSNTVLSANTHWAGEGPSPLARLAPFVIKEIGGVRIAFVGVTHPKVPYWTRQALLRDTVVEQPVTALLRVMPAVRAARPDCIVLLAHLGYNDKAGVLEEELQKVVEQFPDFDVIIGGHTHTAVPSMKFGKTLYTQAAYHGTALGEIRLYFDSDTRALVRSTAMLIPVGPDGPQSALVQTQTQLVATLAEATDTQVLAYINGVLGGPALTTEESPEQTLLCEAIAQAARADIVFHGAFGSGVMLSNQPMTIGDLFAMIPYENGIVVAELTPSEIKEVLDRMIEWWGSSQFAFPYGVRARVDIEGLPGERVIALQDMRGKALEAEKRYRVAFNSYMAASGGQRHLALRALIDQHLAGPVEGTTRDAVAMYLVSTGIYTPRVVRSIEHIVHTPGRFTPVTAATQLSPGALKLVEFAYMHPGRRSEEQASEWFVVRNSGTTPLNLRGYTFTDGDEGGAFRIDKDLLLAPGEVLVFCYSLEHFRRHIYATNPYLRLFEYGKLAGRLNLGNRGDELMVVDPQGRLADQVTYGQHIEKWPNWPAESKAPNHKIGESLLKTPGGWVVNKEPLTQW